MMFRFKALQKQREPDELDSPSLLASPEGGSLSSSLCL